MDISKTTQLGLGIKNSKTINGINNIIPKILEELMPSNCGKVFIVSKSVLLSIISNGMSKLVRIKKRCIKLT